VSLASGCVLPGWVLWRTGTTENQNHKGHKETQRKEASLS